MGPQFAARDAYGVVDVGEHAHVLDFAQALHVCRRAHGVVYDGAFAFGEFEFESHRLDDEEYVGEDDRGVYVQAVRGVSGDLGCDLRLLAHLKKGVARANVSILLHVATGLPHQPDGRVGNLLASAGAHEGAVAQLLGQLESVFGLRRFAHSAFEVLCGVQVKLTPPRRRSDSFSVGAEDNYNSSQLWAANAE